jgi:uncharacterized protein (DUF1810 family)
VDDPHGLQRFIDAQQHSFSAALEELRAGAKRTHWMWFIFPQLRGLGRSPTAQHYGIASAEEAAGYLQHPVLGRRLRECVEALLPWGGTRGADQILGSVDAMKLRSCLTLFDVIQPDSLFAGALDEFYDGERDERTLALLNRQA